MDTKLLEKLSVISCEEQKILDGSKDIQRDLYMVGAPDVINSRKLLEAGKLITLRPHTRFIDFPKHTHDYVEMIYMCNGSTTHIVNGIKIVLNAGELLILNQSATHEVCRANVTDVAVNIIILPEFFSRTLNDLEESSPLRSFLVDCLCGKSIGPGYLYFQVSKVRQIQNLMENLMFTLTEDSAFKRKTSSLTMSLLFLHLTTHADTLCSPEQELVVQVLRYVENHYSCGSLNEIAQLLHYDVAWLSREIKRATGNTFTQLVQKKRLSQAAFLLRTTQQNVADISAAVGYENVSFFHRLFQSQFGMTPRAFRENG